MDTLKFVRALEGEGMDRNHAGIIAHELYALYAHSVLGGKYKAVDYGDPDALTEKARKVREQRQAQENELRKMLAEMDEERKVYEAEQAKRRHEQQAQKVEEGAIEESIRETTRYLDARNKLHVETTRLDFVLEHGLPMNRGGEFRYHGWAHLGWFPTQRAAIDAAVKYPRENE